MIPHIGRRWGVTLSEQIGETNLVFRKTLTEQLLGNVMAPRMGESEEG